MKSFFKLFLTAQVILQGVFYMALILIQLFYPKASVFQLIIAAAFMLVIQVLFIFTKAKGTKQITDK